MAVIAFEVNLATDEVTPSDLDPRNIYSCACWHVQYDDGALRVFAVRDASIRLIGKAAIDSNDAIYTAVGDLGWGRVAAALKIALATPGAPPRVFHVRDTLTPTPLVEGDIVSTDGFATFDLDPETGEASKVSSSREQELRGRADDRTWQIVVVDAAVRVFARSGTKVRQIGRAVRSEGGLAQTTSIVPALSQDYHWKIVAKGIAAARTIVPRTIHEKPRGRGAEPMRVRSRREIVLTIIGGVMFAILVGLLANQWAGLKTFPLWGVHVVLVPFAMALTPYMVARGVFIMTSKEAMAEVSRRSYGGKGDPLTSKGIAMAIVGLMGFLYPCNVINMAKHLQPDVPFSIPTFASPTPAPPPVPTPTPILDAATPTLAETLARVKPQLGDGADNRGARELARFASQHLAWRDVAITDAETTIPLVLKDSELERGKRLCASGTLIDIEREDLDARPVFVGALRTADGDDVRFIAVGSTGSLVKRSTGTLCGIVTGRADKAVMLVGMFDLPENAQPAVER